MSAARRALPEESRRGWCPSLARPMPTGDGLLARVHPPLGILTLAQLRAVAQAARRFGNGHVDVTARGNLQIRGVRDDTVFDLAALLAGVGLGDVRADGGPQRLTLTSPVAGRDPRAGIDVLALARAIEADALRIPGLQAKTLVVIEGPGVTGAEADFVLRPASDGCVCIGLAGDGDDALVASEASAPGAVAALLHAFARTGQRRIRDLAPFERASVLDAARKVLRAINPLPSAGEGGLRVSEGRERGATSPEAALPSPACSAGPFPRGGGRVLRAASVKPVLPVGLDTLDNRTIFTFEAPFGRCTADGLDALAEVACAVGCPEVRSTPSRGFLLVCEGREAGVSALDELALAGFITRSDDPRRGIAACPGAPACASGSTATLRDAERLAEAFRHFAARGLKAHVSGCAKGCAHPAPNDLTLVAEDGCYGIVLHGTSHDAPAMNLTFEAALERVRSADPAAPLAEAFRISNPQ